MMPHQTATRNPSIPPQPAPHQPVPPNSSTMRTSPNGPNLRIDASHTETTLRGNTARTTAPSAQELPPSFQSAATSTTPQRPGVWNPHGVERGMKAMESLSVPAVVRNGVEAVSSEAAKTRRHL
jgi:hypothetical protein